MKNIAFTLFTILIIAGLAAGGYFALQALNDPAKYVSDDTETIGDMHTIVTDPETGTNTDTGTETSDTTTVDTTVVVETSTHAELLKNIETLIANKTILKNGSKGPSVGYIQEFLNLYFNKTLKVDNDFGPTVEANVKAFQKANGVTQTGQIGPLTLGQMVDWLKAN